MFKTACTFLVINFSFLAIAPALHGTCQLCEDIRERNRQHPSSGYTYYEDYLKAEGDQKNADNGNKASVNDQKSVDVRKEASTSSPQTK